jgi:hypothetical protein
MGKQKKDFQMFNILNKRIFSYFFPYFVI